MKKSLLNASDKAEILTRLQSLQPNSPRQWGRMTAHQMMCHLTDSFVGMMGGKAVSNKSNFFSRSVMKWVALQSSLTWPHGIKTMPEMDQEVGGTPPEEFEQDRQKLEQAIAKFTTPQRTFAFMPHPIFDVMTEAEWMIWGYKHCDHHFRQFGI